MCTETYLGFIDNPSEESLSVVAVRDEADGREESSGPHS